MNGRDEQERRAFEWGRASGLGLTQPLGLMRRGGVGRILAVRGGDHDREIERGLLEMGFVEGACVEVLHHGFLGQDPLAVCINQTMTIALRRCEANAVLVGPLLWAYAPAGLFRFGARRDGDGSAKSAPAAGECSGCGSASSCFKARVRIHPVAIGRRERFPSR